MNQNTRFKATTEIHVFIGFNCAANIGVTDLVKRNANCSGGGGDGGDAWDGGGGGQRG